MLSTVLPLVFTFEPVKHSLHMTWHYPSIGSRTKSFQIIEKILILYGFKKEGYKKFINMKRLHYKSP